MYMMCVFLCVSARHVWMGLEARPQRKALGPLDLELQYKYPLWVLRMKLRSSARAEKGPNS